MRLSSVLNESRRVLLWLMDDGGSDDDDDDDKCLRLQARNGY